MFKIAASGTANPSSERKPRECIAVKTRIKKLWTVRGAFLKDACESPVGINVLCYVRIDKWVLTRSRTPHQIRDLRFVI